MTAGGASDRHRPGPAAAAAAAAAARKAVPGAPWSHLETVHLIEAYQEKWYALKRGQLKAQQWEEVANAVAARCGLADGPHKSGTQCRHKVEKLRKRYRAERLRPGFSSWPYFERMDLMERGPLPLSARPPPPLPSVAAVAKAAAVPPSPSPSDDDEEEENEEERIGSNTRSINGILREISWGFPRVARNPRAQKRRDFDEGGQKGRDFDGESEEEEEEHVGGGAGTSMSQLAAVVRRFGENLVTLEKRKLGMLREVERDWMEMEAKRAEMMMESQRCLTETIAGAFASMKKAKKSPDL